MKIVLVGPYLPTIGGVSSHVINLFSRMLDSNHDVKILDVMSIEGDETDNVLRVYQSPFTLIKKTWRLIRNGYRNFHFHISEKGSYILLMHPLLVLFRCKTIITIHAGNIAENYERYSWIDRMRFKLTCRFANKILFVDNVAEDKMKVYLPPTKMDHYASFIIKEDRSETIKNRIYLKNDTLHLISTGLWQPLYQYEHSIEICKRLVNQGLNIKLTLMIGLFNPYQDYKDKIMNLINKANFEFELVEECTTPVELIQQHDFLLRTTNVDSYGLTLAEALSVGTYAFASDICNRPMGTILYKTDDLDELEAKILDQVHKLKNQTAGPFPKNLDDGFPKLYDIYKDVYLN